MGPYSGGTTARISRVDSTGNRTTLASGLPSARAAVGDVDGVADVVFLNGQLYALLAGGGCAHGNPTLPNGIVKVNTHSGSWQYITDLSVFYAGHPAAFPDIDDFEPTGMPYSMIAYAGNLYSIEANHGQLVRTTPDGENSLIADISAHLGHVVPTGLAEANGNLYVASLGQFPITPNWDKLMTFSTGMSPWDCTPGFESNTGDFGRFHLAAVRAGLSAPISLKFGPDGLLYVLELSTSGAPPSLGPGKVLRLSRNGTFEDVVTGLTAPTGMTFGWDHALYISNFGAAPAGAGQILRVPIPM